MNFEGKKANFLGDSITEGYQGTPGKLYLDLVQKELKLECARNYGVCASRFADQDTPSAPSFCQRFPQMDKDADLVVVFGGCNDYFHGIAPIGTFADRTSQTFYGACHTLMRGLLEMYPQSTIVFMTPIHSGDEANIGLNAATGYSMTQYVDVIKEVTGFYGIPTLDLHRLSGLQPQVDCIRERYCPDGTHPNDDGHKLIASRLVGFLKSL